MNSLEARDLVFDLEVVAWQQNGDVDTFTPSSTLMVVPPVYELKPFQRALVRVGFAQKDQGAATERAFQIRFREVQAAGTTQPPRTLTAPVFVPPTQQEGEVRYALERSSEQEARIAVHDDSNVHAYIGELRIVSDGQDVYNGAPRVYVLAGNTRTFSVKLTHAIEGNLAELVIRGESGENKVDVPIR